VQHFHTRNSIATRSLAPAWYWRVSIGVSFLFVCVLPAFAQQSALKPASEQAQDIALLWWTMLYGGIFIFVAVMALLMLGLWQGRRENTAGLSANASRNLVLTAGVAIPALILVVLVGGSLLLGRSIASTPPQSALHIRVTGWMWWWEFQYFDDQGGLIATTANEMHVPVGRPVAVELVSGDVIHSFWVPELHGKTDLVPGKVNSSWFVANKAGVFRGQCAEFCGLQHALMAFVVVAQAPPDFNRWLQRQAADARPPTTPASERGLEVFIDNCGECHRVGGTSAAGDIGPDLTHIASRRTLAAASVANTRGHLAGWISDPQALKPKNFMPRTRLSSEDLNDLIAYLESLD
jgi:cytochrome c oxidase subunit II